MVASYDHRGRSLGRVDKVEGNVFSIGRPAKRRSAGPARQESGSRFSARYWPAKMVGHSARRVQHPCGSVEASFGENFEQDMFGSITTLFLSLHPVSFAGPPIVAVRS